MLLCHLKDIEERDKVVAIIHDRLSHRLTHSLESGEMNDSIDLMLAEKLINRSIVAAINLIERDIVTTCDLLDTLETSHVAV